MSLQGKSPAVHSQLLMSKVSEGNNIDLSEAKQSGLRVDFLERAAVVWKDFLIVLKPSSLYYCPKWPVRFVSRSSVPAF